MAFLPTAGPGVRAILAADPSFDVARFLEGAKGAYRLILESFWKGEADVLRPHVDDHIYETFSGAIAQRARLRGSRSTIGSSAIDQAVISEASAERGRRGPYRAF